MNNSNRERNNSPKPSGTEQTQSHNPPGKEEGGITPPFDAETGSLPKRTTVEESTEEAAEGTGDSEEEEFTKGKSESEDGDEEELNQMLCIDGYDGGDLRKRMAEAVDLIQAPSKRQALEMKGRNEELSSEMLEHIAEKRAAAIQRKIKKAIEE